jgi:hypothetical protein
MLRVEAGVIIFYHRSLSLNPSYLYANKEGS